MRALLLGIGACLFAFTPLPTAAQGEGPAPPDQRPEQTGASGERLDDDAPESIRATLTDLDGDRVPDRVGETVVVAGRATMDAGVLGLRRTTTLTDGDRALWIRSIAAPRVFAGDSLVVRGELSFWNGLAVVENPVVRRVPTDPWTPPPAAVASGDLNRWEGQLITVEGTVAGINRVPTTGQAMMLALDDRSIVTVFVFAGRPSTFDLDDYAVGDRLRVTGIAGQFDRVAPYDATYQIYPRYQDDITRGGIPRAMYAWAAVIAGLLLVAAIAWVLLLRAEVRRRSEAVRQSNAHYRALVNSASDAVFVHRLDGTGVEVNPAARRAFGLTPEASPPSLLDVVVPDHHERAQAHLVMIQARGNARADFDVQPLPSAERHSGEVRPFEFESQLIEIEGEPRVLSLARDVAARRAYEAELRSARGEAEEMARLKSAFLASMSHEIRTPLTAVIGYAELLADELDPEQRELAEIIEQGGRRLLQTLNSVLDLAQLDSGTQLLQLRPLDLNEHTEQSVSLMRSLAEAKGLALDFESTHESLPAMADPGALDRLVANLVGNAIKFTAEGAVSVRLSADGEEAVLEVQDTGIGIDEAFLPDLFSEFRQESEGTGRHHEGSGLGLAITHRLVTMMQGVITVESEKGVGTTFTVRFPRLPGEPGTSAFAPAASLVPTLTPPA